MPAGDGTGPSGMGPMTGRAAGYCAGYSMPGYMNPLPGRGGGFGRGRGRGRGWGRGYGWRQGFYRAPGTAPYYAPYSQEQEVQALQSQAQHMETALAGIKRRIAELDAAKAQGN